MNRYLFASTTLICRNTSGPKSSPQWALLGMASYDHISGMLHVVLGMPVSFGQGSNRLCIVRHIATQPSARQLPGVQTKPSFLQFLPSPAVLLAHTGVEWSVCAVCQRQTCRSRQEEDNEGSAYRCHCHCDCTQVWPPPFPAWVWCVFQETVPRISSWFRPFSR